MNILFMCVANSARSQIAEGLAKVAFPEAHVMSAGSVPTRINPYAIEAMKEVGIDISKQYSKSFNELPLRFVANIDYIIALCAEEVCPSIATRTAKKLCWALPDPATKEVLAPAEHLERFRSTRDELQKMLINFKAGEMLPAALARELHPRK